MWNIWSAVAERVRERRHRFGFGYVEYLECGDKASPRAPTPLWLRVCGIFGVRWQSESASADTALASGIGNIWSAVAERVRERRHRFGFGNLRDDMKCG